MFAENKLTENMAEIEAFLLRERGKALSDAEWRFRMKGYGYNLRRTDVGRRTVCWERLPSETGTCGTGAEQVSGPVAAHRSPKSGHMAPCDPPWRFGWAALMAPGTRRLA